MIDNGFQFSGVVLTREFIVVVCLLFVLELDEQMGCVGQFVGFIVTGNLVHALSGFPGVQNRVGVEQFAYMQNWSRKTCASTVSATIIVVVLS